MAHVAHRDADRAATAQPRPRVRIRMRRKLRELKAELGLRAVVRGDSSADRAEVVRSKVKGRHKELRAKLAKAASAPHAGRGMVRDEAPVAVAGKVVVVVQTVRRPQRNRRSAIRKRAP